MRKLAIALLLPLYTFGQPRPSHGKYPQDYFRNPLDIPILLAGNFGECRPGHFHSGIDIKTSGKENLIVRAAADGYISRIKMDKGGFGHAIYVTHPAGFTTLYAHLNDFAPAIQRYLRKEQYARKKWDIDIQLSPTQFPVKKGQQIAFSGNTGASTAPHLHFEIRNTKSEHPLNPMQFGLQIGDSKAPVIRELAFYSGNIYDTRNKTTVTFAKRGDTYRPVRSTDPSFPAVRDTIMVPAEGGYTGIGLSADDYMDGSDNTLTFYLAQLEVDGLPVSTVRLDDIGYDETRYINAYTDFKTRTLQKKWIQLLFKLPNNKLDGIYTLNNSSGRVQVTDAGAHKTTLTLIDNGGNSTTAEFYIMAAATEAAMKPANCIPFAAGKPNSYDDPSITFTLDETQLYDDICFTFSRSPRTAAYSEQFQLHQPYVPVHHNFDLQIKPNKTIPFDLRDKVVLMYSDGRTEDGKAATFSDKGWYKAAVRNFGTYWLDVDTEAPVIRSMQKNGANLAAAKQIVFEAKDAVTSVKTFGGYLDGEWILFEQHGSRFFYKFDEHCPKGRHELVFKAEDENGNRAEQTLSFTR